MDMPAPPCPVDYHLEGAELMTCKLSDLEYGSSVVLQVPLACLMGVALEQCTGVTETCLRLRLRLRFGTSGVTERCLRLREGLRVLPLSLQTKEHSNIFVAGWIKSLGKTVLLLELACSYKLTGAKEIDVQSLDELGDRKFMNTQVLNIWSWFRPLPEKKKKKTQATSSAPPPKEVLAKQAPQKPGKVLAPRLTSAEAARQKAKVQQQSDARVAAAAAAAAEAEQKEKGKKKREEEEARLKRLQEAKRLKAQEQHLKFMAHQADEDPEGSEQHNPEEISSEDDPGADIHSKPKALKGPPRFAVAGPARGGVKTISAKETRTEANRRGAAYQNNLVATQQTLEDMDLHTARVRYHYRNCLEMGGPIVQKKGEAGRTEARDLRETLGYALCCVVKCSQPVAMDYLGVRAQYAPGAGTARTKLMQRYRLTAAEADALAGISSLRPYPHVSSAVAADTLSYPR